MEVDSVVGIEHDHTTSVLLDDLPIKPQKECTAETATRHYREFALAELKSLSHNLLSDGQKNLPPLLKDFGQSPVYDMGPERGGEVRASLVVTSEPPGQFQYCLPLRMLPYKTPSDPKLCFDLVVCQAADSENAVLETHNKYITSLISLFVIQNGCGTSAGHVTLPPPPDSLLLTRQLRLKALRKDKHSLTMLAVRYLYQLGKICEQDYLIEDAPTVADDAAYEEYIRMKKARGNFRFRIPGSPPAFWDGVAEHRDSLGRKVKWEKNEQHSFISAVVNIVADPCELVVA